MDRNRTWWAFTPRLKTKRSNSTSSVQLWYRNWSPKSWRSIQQRGSALTRFCKMSISETYASGSFRASIWWRMWSRRSPNWRKNRWLTRIVTVSWKWTAHPTPSTTIRSLTWETKGMWIREKGWTRRWGIAGGGRIERNYLTLRFRGFKTWLGKRKPSTEIRWKDFSWINTECRHPEISKKNRRWSLKTKDSNNLRKCKFSTALNPKPKSAKTRICWRSTIENTRYKRSGKWLKGSREPILGRIFPTILICKAHCEAKSIISRSSWTKACREVPGKNYRKSCWIVPLETRSG